MWSFKTWIVRLFQPTIYLVNSFDQSHKDSFNSIGFRGRSISIKQQIPKRQYAISYLVYLPTLSTKQPPELSQGMNQHIKPVGPQIGIK
jgi:hypothetical protein